MSPDSFVAIKGQSFSWPIVYPGYSGNNINDIVVLVSTASGVSDPNFKIKLVKHQDASHAVSLSGLNQFRYPGFRGNAYIQNAAGAVENNSTHHILTDGVAFPVGQFPADSASSDRALVRLKNKLKNETKQLQALVPLVELRDLRNTIKSSINFALGTAQILVDLKHGKLPRGRKLDSFIDGGMRKRAFHNYASDAWLNYSFGIKPLVADINNAAASIAKYLARDQGRVVRERAGDRVTWKTSSDYSNKLSAIGFSNDTVTAAYTHELTTNWTCGFQAFVSGANNYGPVEHFGLDVKSLPSVLWELTAFSWMADYFTNIGDYLQDNFESPSGNTVYCDRSVKYTCKGEFNWNGKIIKATSYDGHAIKHSDYLLDNGVSDTWSFQRSVYSALPHVGLHFKSVDQVSGNALPKLLNLISILGK